ncbi:MAG TPA: hypothetical protein VE521_01145 [Nitrososphaera sp.]|nr:hypothetical protein [Nitrososphaera sp.]
MTIKAQLLVLIIRLDYVEKKLMRLRNKMTHKKQQQLLEQVICETNSRASTPAKLGDKLSVMWPRFKSAVEHKEAEAAFILMQRKEERKDKRDSIFTEW